MHDIKIGTLVNGSDAAEMIPKLVPFGFESFAITFWQTTGGTNLPELAKRVRDITGPAGIPISCLSVFGNALTNTGANSDVLASWERLIDNAHLFDCGIITGFTGRIPNEPVDKSIPKLKEVFGELLKHAEAKGLKIAFENCNMDGDWHRGDWNIAFNPAAWEMIFNALPSDSLGLEWEPCHQMVQLIDPMPQLRKWTSKIFHVHGKDATIAWDVIKEYGAYGAKRCMWHRTPGFGDSNWTDIISLLRLYGYKGNIDIEGWHDPVYRNELEYTGQVRGLNYLKECRGGAFVDL